MSIEFFEKKTASGDAETIADLLHDAGFTDVTYTTGSVATFSSASGIYGVHSFKVNSFPAYTYFLVKDDARKALYIYPRLQATNTAEDYSRFYVIVVIVDGVLSEQPDNTSRLSTLYNVTGGKIKTPVDTSDALLTPLIDKDTQLLTPFYISANRVCHTAKTVVTDGVNSFTSLGNLVYIKNA